MKTTPFEMVFIIRVNMNEIQKKIQHTSRAVAVIIKILYISAIVAVCFELAGIIWMMILPQSSSFTLGHIKVISPFLFAANQVNTINLFTSISSQSFFIAILILTNRIFKDISLESSPFLPKNIGRMRRIALLLLIDSLISPSIDTAIRKSISLTVTNSSYFNSEMIILAIVIYCFALIFQYGVELQQQSDETL